MTPSTQSVLRRIWSWCPLFWVRHIPRDPAPGAAPGASQRYLDRYSIRRQLPSGQNAWRVYLHAFFAADSEGHHNHPCRWGWALVLRGSYTEEVLHDPLTVRPQEHLRDCCPTNWRDLDSPWVETRRVRWFNWVPASKYHRIVALHPRRPGEAVWTLFFMGPLTGAGWGFWCAGRGHVPHEVREAERAEEAAELAKILEPRARELQELTSRFARTWL